MKNKNKQYNEINFEKIFSDFYKLERDIKETATKNMQDYTIIHLVTIIEQFFRVVVILKLSDAEETGTIEDIITEKTITLLKTHIVSALEQQDETKSSYEIWKCVEQFFKIKLKNNGKITNDSITIPVTHLKELIEACSRHSTYILRYILIATSFSFQNTNCINNTMKKLKIFTEIDVFFGDNKTKFDNLFDARHNLIHSIGSHDLNTQLYFKLIETLFCNALETIRPGVSYFDFEKGKTLCAMERHDEAITCLLNAVEHRWHEPRASMSLSESLFNLNRTEHAYMQLQYALFQANNIGEIVLKSKKNGENHESTDDMLHDITLNCIGIGQMAYNNFGDKKLAEKATFNALSYNTEQYNLYYLIGKNFEAINEYGMAIICYNRLIEKYPNNVKNNNLLKHISLLTKK